MDPPGTQRGHEELEAHRVVAPTGHVPDHHVGHRHHLAVLGLLDEDGHTAGDELTVELDALRARDELPVRVVSCENTRQAASKTEQPDWKTSVKCVFFIQR